MVSFWVKVDDQINFLICCKPVSILTQSGLNQNLIKLAAGLVSKCLVMPGEGGGGALNVAFGRGVRRPFLKVNFKELMNELLGVTLLGTDLEPNPVRMTAEQKLKCCRDSLA